MAGQTGGATENSNIAAGATDMTIGQSVVEAAGSTYDALGDPMSKFFKAVTNTIMADSVLNTVTPFLPTAMVPGQDLGKVLGGEAEVFGKNNSPLVDAVLHGLQDMGLVTTATLSGNANPNALDVGHTSNLTPVAPAEPVATASRVAPKVNGPGGMG